MMAVQPNESPSEGGKKRAKDGEGRNKMKKGRKKGLGTEREV